MQNLDHQIYSKYKAQPFQFRKVLLAFSGGVDSSVLLHILSKWSQFEIFLGHVHHGQESNADYRDRVRELTIEAAKKYSIELYETQLKGVDQSEESLREARHQHLQKWKTLVGADVIVTGHHLDDLLETRLLKLLRGAGKQGFVSFQEKSLEFWRPLLETSKAQILEYAEKEGISYLEDPTNKDSEPLRNWLRNEWLPALEAKLPKGVEVLGRSLNHLAEELQGRDDVLQIHNRTCGSASEQGLSLIFLATLNPKARQALLAGYLLNLKKRDFSLSQIEEILKRLDSSQKVHTFKVASLVWSVNAGRVKVLD